MSTSNQTNRSQQNLGQAVPVQQKNIILCADGTGNTGGVGKDTNVWRIYDAIDVSNTQKQIAYYDDGVGVNNNMLMKAIGLAFGFGLSKNIRQLYKNAVMHYNQGDQLFLFGFSRGAHTIRLLAELICTFGILNRKAFDNEHELDIAIKRLQRKFKAAIRRAWLRKLFFVSSSTNQAQFRQKTEKALKSKNTQYEQTLKKQVLKQHQKKQKPRFVEVKITFLGVWDTVSAVGMPIDEMRDNIFFASHAFVDNKLNKQVTRACHALAIDEQRHTFKPELWDQTDPADQDRIEQVWFTGVHSNVGGGYPKDQLSLVSLKWMIEEASVYGLQFINSRVTEITNHATHSGTLYDSRAGVASFYRYKPRDIQLLTEQTFGRAGVKPKVHISAYERIRDASADYSPVNLPVERQIIGRDRNNLANQLASQPPRHYKPSKYYDVPWNIIWWQKALHFGFMLYFFFFIYLGYNLTRENDVINTDHDWSAIRWLKLGMEKLSDLNPFYITNKILPGYANNLAWLLLIVAIFILIYLLRASFKKHLYNMGNVFWSFPPFDKHRVDAERLNLNMLYKSALMLAAFMSRKTALTEIIMPFIKKKAIPIIMSVAFTYLIAQLLWSFAVEDFVRVLAGG